MIVSFCVRNASTFVELALARYELLLLLLEGLELPVEVLQLGLGGGLALERGARGPPPCGKRLAGLGVELDEALLELVRPQLQPLLGGDDVGDAPLDVLEELQLALVRVVERLARVLGAVEQLRELRLDHHRGSGHQAGHSCLPKIGFDD